MMINIVSDRACHEIRRMVTDGEFAPGARVTRNRLARQLGCSPQAVAEAIRRLESEGLLVKEGRKQARVRAFSVADLEELYSLREAIESVAARLAAEKITSEEARRLRELSQRFEQEFEAGRREAANQADIALHRYIADCARSTLLAAELDRLRLLEQTAGRRIDESHPTCNYSHRAVVQAIVDRDAEEAERLMKKHVQQGFQAALRQLAEAPARRPRRRATEAGAA